MDNLENIIAQEQEYQFETFSHNDAKKLGLIMIDLTEQFNEPLCFEIEINGLVVFRFMPQGTSILNELWMEKKRSTVRITSKSTMRFWIEMAKIGFERKITSIEPLSNIALCGGGFPIKIKNGSVIGAIVASGSTDQNDHDFIIKSLKEFFQ